MPAIYRLAAWQRQDLDQHAFVAQRRHDRRRVFDMQIVEDAVERAGGDGVPPFDVSIDVPRPVRVTWVGSHPVRGAQVPVPPVDEDLTLRWGSVDGTADLDLLLGADVPAGLGWLHCRLRDDGEFTVPKSLVALLPSHSPEHPWLARLSRSREVPIPGFEALPLRLELSDSAWLQ